MCGDIEATVNADGCNRNVCLYGIGSDFSVLLRNGPEVVIRLREARSNVLERRVLGVLYAKTIGYVGIGTRHLFSYGGRGAGSIANFRRERSTATRGNRHHGTEAHRAIVRGAGLGVGPLAERSHEEQCRRYFRSQ
jgi:hypothetical protein